LVSRTISSTGVSSLMEEMVRETKQALLWLKQHADSYGVDPERIVLMGSSAGGHLALLTAYTPGHLAFQPRNISGDERVHGVVAFYPPTDFLELYQHTVERTAMPNEALGVNPLNWALYGLLWALGLAKSPQDTTSRHNFITKLLGGAPDDIPEIYRLLSHINHVSPRSPPTMLIIGEREKEDGTVTVRKRNGDNLPPMSVQEFADMVRRECEEGTA
jgi:acetyl esterase/lipase